jgi:hypothetical protein
MTAKQNQYINLELSGIMGMGAVGPTLAMLTATLYSAVAAAMDNPPNWVYPVIMLVLSGLLAVFPTVKAKYSTPLKCVLWPIATAIVFAAAWGVNHGLSVGEEALNGDDEHVGCLPSLVSTAYADTNDNLVAPLVTNKVRFVGTNTANWEIVGLTNTWEKAVHPAKAKGAKLNEVDFSVIDSKTKTKVPESFKKDVPEGIWGITTAGEMMYLKGRDGEWYSYRPKAKKVKPVRPDPKQVAPIQQQEQMKGGFFKRF